ncbi:MAG: GTPase (G3E family) [Lachnospiraceae bacterium]|nr:GTPase (G3E family) [Lachnospiraceae bacterium]
MIKIDLITGFLGAGKTTFLKRYAKYYIDRNQKVGILENDLGAVNVDMLLLQDLRGENCEIEMVIGGDRDCRYRRLKTKLISMSMTGYDRIIMEPSGIFDMDDFYDVLREEPLDKWYEIGSIIAIMDARVPQDMSRAQEYVMASQIANAGTIVFSKLDKVNEMDIKNAYAYLDQVTKEYNTRKNLRDIVVEIPVKDMSDEDIENISSSGYQLSNYVKKVLLAERAYMTIYLLEHGLTEAELKDKINQLFNSDKYGEIYRIKGFFGDDAKGWCQLNATKDEFTISPINKGQEVIIIIGNDLAEEDIKSFMGCDSQ